MKKSIAYFMVLALIAGIPFANMASCGSNVPIANAAQAAFTGLSATAANVNGQIWIFGRAIPGTTGGGVKAPNTCTTSGCDHGTMTLAALDAATCAEFDTSHMLYESTGCALPGYLVLTDWSNAGFDSCPNNITDRVVILAEDNTGMYSLISMVSNGSDWSTLDAVPTQAATAYTRIASITRTSAAGVSPAVFDVALTGNPASASGASADAFAGTIITGYEIYYQNAAVMPTSALPGAWTLCTNGTIAGFGTNSATGVQAPLPGVGNTYLLVRMTFESGMKASYGSQIYTSFPPTAAPIFASFAADASSATWTSGTETRVSSYQVYWSTTANGSYQAAGMSVAPKGDNQAYSTSYRVLTTANTYYVKVKASKTDGTFEFTAPVQVTKSTKTTTAKPLTR